MLKIKNSLSIISTTNYLLSKSLIHSPKYAFHRILKQSSNQVFGDTSKQKQQKPSFLGKQSIDHLTQDALKQYQQKIKQIRQQNFLIQNKISMKYAELLKSHQAATKGKSKKVQTDQNEQNEQDQLESIKQDLQIKRLNQIIDSQVKGKRKIDKLTSDYNIKFAKARKQYELQYIKNYMLENVQQEPSDSKEFSQLQELMSGKDKDKQQAFIPNNLVLKKLFFKMGDGKERQVLLAGVEQNDEDHCAYLKTLIEKMHVKNVLTMMSPDMPYFIKTETSFLTEWMQFLKTPSTSIKFYLNPNPKTLNDITLQKSHIPYVLNGMTRSKSFYQTTYSLMQLNESNFKYEHQPLYSGLASNTVENVFFCDYPFLKQRQMIAMNMSLQNLRQLVKQYAYYKQNDKQHFSAELLLPKNVVETKFRHIIKLAKTIALMNDSTPVLICEASIAEVLTEQWKKAPSQFLQFDYSQNSYLLDMELSKQPQSQALFIQFIQKLVILDIILKPLIQNYFVKYESFPYSCRNTIGGKENLTKVFLLWKHYFTLYSNAVQEDRQQCEKQLKIKETGGYVRQLKFKVPLSL